MLEVNKLPALVRWNESLDIGVGYIDLEHKVMLMLVQKLDRAIRCRAPKSTMVLAVAELFEFTKFHFLSEENLMRETDYPGLIEHEKAHSLLLSELSVVAGRINRGLADPVETISFLRKWLLTHIVQMDRPVSAHIHEPSQPRAYLAQAPFDDTFPGLSTGAHRAPTA